MSKSKYVCALLFSLMALTAVRADDPPSPYRRVDNWAKLPAGMKFGQAISVDGDAAGHVWVFHRGEPPVLEFDTDGNLLKSFGQGMFVQSHGLCLDPDGSLWLSDGRAKDGRGEQVFKVTQDGKVLMTLGKAGVAGTTPETFNAPSDIAIGRNGDIFVADGHGGQTNARIVKFSKDGKFIKTWGKLGSAPGDFNIPHSLAFDSQGRLFVADRGNNRIQIFDQDGNFIAEWKQFGRPSGIFIAKDDTMYVVDSESNKARNPGFKRGIRIGSAKDGSIKAFIPDIDPNPDTTTILGAEGVGVDSKGDVYAAQVGRETITKFVRTN
ncbi:MAG TPA: peptidyl-alpha-hydroxyglycine alpha-amidating lyase family protein [Bryobacteraceae bacterium]|nr:peptidyl-alpha-hydroxyglycine alpha-amidating lyase family protein [Bryobacteraceae bacterium]